ncbi:MAG: ABC transporter permease [Clostridium sp.]|nr:ABC transporter permease [Clostridium sp.]
MNIIVNILEQGMLFSMAVMGIYITYKIMNFPDLSIDGTFPLGAAVCGVLIINGVNPIIATLLAAFAGAMGGMITGLLHTKLKINGLMAGILMMFGLYSVNLRIMGKTNIALFNEKSVFTLPKVEVFGVDISSLLLLIGIIIVLKVIFDLFFNTKAGFFLKAVGDNEEILTSLGADPHKTKIMGLMFSNFLAGLSGALTAQYQGFSDVSMGVGSAVTALAAVIIGYAILQHRSVKMSTIAIFGAVLYRSILVVVLRFGLDPNDFKLATAVTVIIAMGLSQGGLGQTMRNRKKARKHKGGENLARNQEPIENL